MLAKTVSKISARSRALSSVATKSKSYVRVLDRPSVANGIALVDVDKNDFACVLGVAVREPHVWPVSAPLVRCARRSELTLMKSDQSQH